jgi:peptidoglycan biosynthesis protein MviN/MurJ (putative lipid II flippase)
MGIACGVLDIVLALLLLGPLEYLGIAWAYLVARTAKMIGLAVLLHRKSPGIFGPALAGFLIRLFACNVVTCGALWLLCDGNVEGSAARVALRGVLLPALGAGGAFAGSSLLLRIEEFHRAIALIRWRKRALVSFPEGAR